MHAVDIVDVDEGLLVTTKSYSLVKSNAAIVATAVAAPLLLLLLLLLLLVGDLCCNGGDIGVGDMNVSTEVMSSRSKKFQLLVDTSLISS